jgi:hypothetical protein
VIEFTRLHEQWDYDSVRRKFTLTLDNLASARAGCKRLTRGEDIRHADLQRSCYHLP